MAKKHLDFQRTLSTELLEGVYNPEFFPEELDVTDFLKTDMVDVAQKTLQPKIDAPPQENPAGTSNAPLTVEEANEADRRIELTKQRLKLTRERVANVRSRLDDEMAAFASERGAEVNFKLEIKKKGRVKRAIRRLFGRKTDTITYSMYLELLAAKERLEDEESDGYVNGWPEE